MKVRRRLGNCGRFSAATAVLFLTFGVVAQPPEDVCAGEEIGAMLQAAGNDELAEVDAIMNQVLAEHRVLVLTWRLARTAGSCSITVTASQGCGRGSGCGRE